MERIKNWEHDIVLFPDHMLRDCTTCRQTIMKSYLTSISCTTSSLHSLLSTLIWCHAVDGTTMSNTTRCERNGFFAVSDPKEVQLVLIHFLY